MKEILHSYQKEAIMAIQKAITKKQKRIVVDMPTGFGKGIILNKTIEFINGFSNEKILVVTSCKILQEDIKQRLLKNNIKGNIYIETRYKAIELSNEEIEKYQYVIFFDITNLEYLFQKLLCKNKKVIVFSYNKDEFIQQNFKARDIVFSYTFQQAVEDGYITPAMDIQALTPTFANFVRRLLESFGYEKHEYLSKSENDWAMVVQNQKHKLWVDCKSFKSQVVSPASAIEILKNVLARKQQQKIAEDDIVLLVVLSRIPSFQKDEIYNRYRIIVLDIDNLVFYSKDNSMLLKQLSQVTYFPIDHIEGQISNEVSESQIFEFSYDSQKQILEDQDETSLLVQGLKNCKPGKEFSLEYEEICEKIIRVLFETNYFNKLVNQHKTQDSHFRMDLIGSLKTNQSNDESMHPLWQMFVQHYNTHFIVFEFKNYEEEIDQNLIYITEKYLFNATLRNVAFIISRKGFSNSAKFAAEGCLKENGKLIIDINDNDLIEMIKLKSDKAADYLLDKVEEFLMGISK